MVEMMVYWMVEPSAVYWADLRGGCLVLLRVGCLVVQLVYMTAAWRAAPTDLNWV